MANPVPANVRHGVVRMSDISGQLVDQVCRARLLDRTLDIVGNGSKIFLGRESQGEEIAVGGHYGIVNYEPAELVVTARAGTRVSEVEAALRECGQMFAFEPPTFAGRASLGGTLACNLSGPARPWSGSIRDMVLGVKIVNGKGEHLTFGGQVMKNVAGYDVSRLQAGAMGAFGIITEISLRVVPIPPATKTLRLDMGAPRAIESMNRFSTKAVPLSGACWIGGSLYLRLSGAKSAVTDWTARLGGEVQRNGSQFWRELREYELGFFTGDQPLWRFSLKPTAEHSCESGNWLIDWGGAQRWLRGHFDRKSLVQHAESAAGQVALFRGGNRECEVCHELPKAVAAIHRRLKAAFDPDGLFNPGRLYGWL